MRLYLQRTPRVPTVAQPVSSMEAIETFSPLLHNALSHCQGFEIIPPYLRLIYEFS